MKKFSLSSLVAGIIIGAILFSGAYAIASGISAYTSTWKFFVDGNPRSIDAYSIQGSNYLKLRDVFEIADVGVWYDGSKGEVYIERDKGYDANYNGPGTETTPPSTTVSQQNAVKTAKNYLNYSAFSRNGLISQLEYEEYSHEDAVYGADNCGADWFEQAAKKAQQYMDYSSFSRAGLIEQLIYEEFTREQAEYGADSVGL